MIEIILFIFGVIFGSFVNALVWRLHEQSLSNELSHGKQNSKENASRIQELSIIHGRSMCPNCNHQLGPIDLIPIISWVVLRSRCRYCKHPISVSYPLVEFAVGALFVLSFIFWPYNLSSGFERLYFILWLMLLPGLTALFLYDIHWYLLPNRLLFVLAPIALIMASIVLIESDSSFKLITVCLSILIGGGIFYLLFQLSNGSWIGGGDVKLGWLLGLIVLTPSKSLLVIFIAAILGTIVSIPLLLAAKLPRNKIIPFGPFLISATFIVVLFGDSILHWYTHL